MNVTKWIQAALVAAIVLGFFAVFGVFALVKVDPAVKETLSAMTSTLTNVLLVVVGYFFGSSSGSAKKDDFLTKEPKQ
jgi:uncharacterized membrane protein